MIIQLPDENAERPTPNAEYRMGVAVLSYFDVGRWTLNVGRFDSQPPACSPATLAGLTIYPPASQLGVFPFN
ncbi:MAG TPA: hypothetical protein VEX43_17040 [Chthoniobacterales bacterium]|nr:hypothetical protein [Chthoniobacterales bacterium]